MGHPQPMDFCKGRSSPPVSLAHAVYATARLVFSIFFRTKTNWEEGKSEEGHKCVWWV